MKEKPWKLGVGTVQCYIAGGQPFDLIHYGRPEYQRDYPIMTDSLQAQGQAVCDKLNSGDMTAEEARTALAKIRY